MSPFLITILGPTAVGKTKLSALLADHFNGEIISADSRQVYRGMDIGTGKDILDYNVNGKQIPFHLIDICSPEEEFNLFDFQNEFNKAFSFILKNKKLPFLTGGTGLYLHSILKKYSLTQIDFNSQRAKELESLDNDSLIEILLKLKPDQHNSTDLEIKERIIKAILIAEDPGEGISVPDFHPIVIGINPGREIVKKRITERLKLRLKEGMIEEVENLIKSGISHEKLDFFGLEYRFISQYLRGELNYNDMSQKLNSAIHTFAKRQMTWFRKFEKEGIEINWLDNPDFNSSKSIIEKELNAE